MNSQFVISVELLLALKWLLEHEREGLRRVIARAMERGLDEELRNIPSGMGDNEDLHQSVADFFTLLERMIARGMAHEESDDALTRAFIPAINKIDTHYCDERIVKATLAKTAPQLNKKSPDDLKNSICKELLKQWKPKKAAAH
jgi:hypothetical protein